MDINSLSREELTSLLKKLKTYKSIMSNLGKRGQAEFERLESGKPMFTVEYYPTLTEDEAFNTASGVIEKVFGDKVEKSEITFTSKESIKGWIRVFKNDNMVDLSFSKIEKALK